MAKKTNTIILLFLALVLTGGCVDFTINSYKKNREIVIDGQDSEWQDIMFKYQNVAYAIANDDKCLYLCLSITDKRAKAQMMGLFKQEFNVWFDPAGQRKKTFGIRFSNDSPLMDEALIKRMGYLRTQSFQQIGEEMMKNLIIEVTLNDNPVAFLKDVKGIDVAAGISLSGRKLTYEFKIPLTASEGVAYAIESRPGKTISLGLDTSEIDYELPVRMSGGGFDDPKRMNPNSEESAVYRELSAFRYIRVYAKIKLAGFTN